MADRRCSRPACPHPPAASMSYDYATATVYVGRLADERHPALYDLCRHHLDHLTPPRGWTLRREPLTAVGSASDDQWAEVSSTRTASRDSTGDATRKSMLDTPAKAGGRNAI